VYLATEARRWNKTVGSLEAPESHCEVIGLFLDLKIYIYISVCLSEKVGDLI
jgi:hypothetical protein